MTRKEAENLLSKYEQGLCDEEELAWIETWYIQLNEDRELNLRAADLEESEYRMMQALNIQEPKTVSLWKKVAVAASIILVATFSYYFLQRSEILSETNATNLANTPIRPGGNKAVLILSDGREINLEETAKGEVAEVAGVTVIKKASGQVIFKVNSTNTDIYAQERYHTIATPRGGTYQILLEDGSKVWLNAASSVKFPSSFSDTTRVVELHGEAYFEIAKNPNRPFTVHVDGQSIKVLGTKFNVSSYANETKVATTLLEGSVSLTNKVTAVTLKPGQQALSSNQKIRLTAVNPADFLAWKDGMFSFHRADLKTVLRQFERWYNIDVEYEEDVPELFFTGKIYRNLNLDDALNNLKFLGVKFNIANRKVTVLSE